MSRRARRIAVPLVAAVAMLAVPVAAQADPLPAGEPPARGTYLDPNLPASALPDAKAGKATVRMPLRRGMRGPAVRALQRRLRIAADGVFGPRTEAAVRRFQRSRGLAADGIVGPATAGRLRVSLPRRRVVPVPRTSTGVSSLLARIAQCESGGNPRAVSPDGRYRGLYQFDLSTWRSVGGTGDPAAAPAATQHRMAARLLARRGTAPWPNCGR